MEIIIILMNLSIVFLAIGNYYLDKRLDYINERLILVIDCILEELQNRVASASGTEYGATKGD